MYTNLFFLILMLLLVDIGPQIGAANVSPGSSAIYLMAAYLCTLCLIVFQNFTFTRFLRRFQSRMLVMANLELIAFFCAGYFYFGFPDQLKSLPLIGQSKLMTIIIPFGAYFLGLLVFHLSSRFRQDLSIKVSIKKSLLELRLLLPFLIPIFLLTLFREGVGIYSNLNLPKIPLLSGNDAQVAISVISGLSFLGLVMILLPPLMIWTWQCIPLEEGPLLRRLEALCQKAGIKHAGIMVWKPLENSTTAAVIGVAPRFRYLLFTPRMLTEMKPELVEAVLCHEIGHCYRKHLYIYPFILAGMAISASLFSYFLSDQIVNFLNAHIDHGSIWEFFISRTMIFLFFAVIFGLYFRFVFGYFSRLFERQADLHVFQLGLNPDHLIEAFKHMGKVSGHGLSQPSWHHYSLQKRVDFLEDAKLKPETISRHHCYVKRMLFLYFILLVIMTGGLYLT